MMRSRHVAVASYGDQERGEKGAALFETGWLALADVLPVLAKPEPSAPTGTCVTCPIGTVIAAPQRTPSRCTRSISASGEGCMHINLGPRPAMTLEAFVALVAVRFQNDPG